MYLFNPDHDLALANFTPNYTPPASAIRIAEELALLPLWYADTEEAAIVIAEGEASSSFVKAVQEILPVKASVIPFSDVALYPLRKIIPWGWNPALRRKLISLGVDKGVLPLPEELVRLRVYSSRLHAVEILDELQNDTHVLDTGKNRFCGESHFFTNADELYAWLQSVSGDKVLKMPLSGSGKGLIWILGEITCKQRDWCRRVIREQGGVVAEPVLTKVHDFAMEFYLHNGQVCFAGYSLFRAAEWGAYTGNELLSDARIEEKLSGYVPVELLRWLRNALTDKLSHYFPLYNGYAGVDMMVCETPTGYGVQPCVEINMRMNMGMVARIFHRRYMHAGAEGTFTVDYFAKPGSALLFHEKMQRESPLSVKNGKIISGYLSLAPVTQSTHYIAYVKN